MLKHLVSNTVAQQILSVISDNSNGTFLPISESLSKRWVYSIAFLHFINYFEEVFHLIIHNY